MTWIKLEEKAPRHPKIVGLSDRAFRVWVTALCYASEFLTDGILPPVYLLTVKASITAELIAARLWEVTDGVTQIHDYLGHQSSRSDVDHSKQRNRQKAKAWRDRNKTDVTGNGVTDSNRSLTEPEIRDQRTDTENREQRWEKPRPTLIARGEGVKWFQRHGAHVDGFCDWVCLDEQQASEFAAKVPGDDHALKVQQVREWALDVRRQWADRIVGDGSHFDFWRNRWTETHGGSRPANATLKAAQAAKSIDEAFR